MGFLDKLAHGWNAFKSDEESTVPQWSHGQSYSSSTPMRRSTFVANERSIITSMYNRIAVDVAAVLFKHVQLDSAGRYQDDRRSGLNYCLTQSANIDQTGSAFRQDMAMTLLTTGHIAVVPVDVGLEPTEGGGFDIKSMRVGEVVEWFPKHVRIALWDENSGQRKEIILSKSIVAIIQNPMFAVMNEPNSTLQRLIRKLNLLDTIDEQAGSGKLDIILQLPYVIKNDTKRDQAETRRKDIEMQLKDSKYGIAYMDSVEKITQLNRPVENNMLAAVKYLTEQLYGELGTTLEVMNGTASEAAMLNYYNRTVEPILRALAEGIQRAFLTKTAITQGQAIAFFRDPFKLVPISTMADIADKFSRNEILTPNEIRGFIGVRPATDPKAELLRNSNMPQPEEPKDLGVLTPKPPLAIEQKT